MKIKTFCRSALAKSSNNLRLLALSFRMAKFIGAGDVNSTRTHADARQIKCMWCHRRARHYSINIQSRGRNVSPYLPICPSPSLMSDAKKRKARRVFSILFDAFASIYHVLRHVEFYSVSIDRETRFICSSRAHFLRTNCRNFREGPRRAALSNPPMVCMVGGARFSRTPRTVNQPRPASFRRDINTHTRAP